MTEIGDDFHRKQKPIEMSIVLRSPMSGEIIYDVFRRASKPLSDAFVSAVQADMRRVMPNGVVQTPLPPVKGIDPKEFAGIVYPIRIFLPEAVA